MVDRIEVVAGGVPTDEEVAAIVLALTPVAPPGDPGDDGPPPWRRASMLEGVGARPVSSAPDLARSRRIDPV